MKKEIFGYSRSSCGTKVYIDTVDGMEIVVEFKNHKDSWDFYCNPLKITLEIIEKDELKEEIENSEKRNNKSVSKLIVALKQNKKKKDSTQRRLEAI